MFSFVNITSSRSSATATRRPHGRQICRPRNKHNKCAFIDVSDSFRKSIRLSRLRMLVRVRTSSCSAGVIELALELLDR